MGMKKWWLVGAVAGLMLLGACQSETEDKRILTGFEAGEAVKEVGEEASVSVREAMEGVQEDHEVATVTAKKFVDFTYEASDIAEFCEGIDVLGEQTSFISFEEGAGELVEDKRFDWPSPREVFDELMGRC